MQSNCFAACGCENPEGVTSTDLDRFTDTIENVLSDEKGRKLFRNFMYTSKLNQGRAKLDVWEHNEKLLGYEENEAKSEFLEDVDKLIDKAEKLNLDLAIMERLTEALDSKDKGNIIKALQALKLRVTELLKREYQKFRSHYTPA